MYLTVEQLLALHLVVLEGTGGAAGVRTLSPLESAVAVQTQAVFGRSLYPTIFEKAAAVCHRITTGHPFVDGNKRTSMLAALTLLRVNGQTLNFVPGEIEDFAVKIATDKLDVPDIAAWLEAHAPRR